MGLSANISHKKFEKHSNKRKTCFIGSSFYKMLTQLRRNIAGSWRSTKWVGLLVSTVLLMVQRLDKFRHAVFILPIFSPAYHLHWCETRLKYGICISEYDQCKYLTPISRIGKSIHTISIHLSDHFQGWHWEDWK